MLKFGLGMLIPLGVCIYTVSFGRWMQQKQQLLGAISAYLLACLTVFVSGAVLWRMFA